MTQITFANAENNPTIHAKLNQAVQGWRFLRRATFLGLTGPLLYNCHPRASAMSVRLIGPGGGGGGAASSTGTSASAGAGGGAGGYYELFSTDEEIVRQTFTILAPRGGSGGGPASPGSSASSGAAIIYPGALSPITLALSGPGLGGQSMPAGTFFAVSLGGVGGAAFNTFVISEDIGMRGGSGGLGFRFAANIALSGRGGNSVFRGAGAEVGGGPGAPSASFGGGGSGGSTSAAQGGAGQSGGRGGDACVILDEYY